MIVLPAYPKQLLGTLFDEYVESYRQMGDQNDKKGRTKKKRVALNCDLSTFMEKTVDESKLPMNPKKRRTQQQQKTQKSGNACSSFVPQILMTYLAHIRR